MKILIAAGILIVFISAFFMIMTGDIIFKTSFDCADENGSTVCSFSGFSAPSAMALGFIVFFLLVDAFTVYLIFTNIT